MNADVTWRRDVRDADKKLMVLRIERCAMTRICVPSVGTIKPTRLPSAGMECVPNAQTDCLRSITAAQSVGNQFCFTRLRSCMDSAIRMTFTAYDECASSARLA